MTEKLSVYLAGEGRNELGTRAAAPNYQSDDEPGVIHSLLRRVRPDGWDVAGACCWKDIRKYRAGGRGHADRRNVWALVLAASERNCDVVAFIRDADGDGERVKAVEQAIQDAKKEFGETPGIIGGAAIPTLEGWMLALLGVRKTEDMTPTKATAELSKRGHFRKSSLDMVRVASDFDFGGISQDAQSLLSWLRRANEILSEGQGE